MSRAVEDRLRDIIDAIAHARIADARMKAAELAGDSEGVQVAFESVLHNLFVIGEAVKAIPAEILDQAPHVPWVEIAAMRDVIGHQYHRIVPAIVHRTVEYDLTPLEGSVQLILQWRLSADG